MEAGTAAEDLGSLATVAAKMESPADEAVANTVLNGSIAENIHLMSGIQGYLAHHFDHCRYGPSIKSHSGEINAIIGNFLAVLEQLQIKLGNPRSL